MIALLAQLVAIAALNAQPQAWAPEFTEPLIAECQPIIAPGTFIGCDHGDPSQDETEYAGLIWIDGAATLDVGP